VVHLLRLWMLFDLAERRDLKENLSCLAILK
jgi:hypothetical protein